MPLKVIMIKGCIFDLDGTLTNTIDTISHFVNNALNEYAITPIEKDKFKLFVGDGASVLIERSLKYKNMYNEDLHRKVLDFYNKTYDNDFLYLTTVYDGIFNLLKYLKDNDIKIGVVSNKPHSTTLRILSTLFEPNTFDDCFGQRDGLPLKPNPYSVLELLKLWNINNEECLYVGDTKTDMITAQNANLFKVGVLWGFRDRKELEDSNADLVVNHPKEIEKFLKGDM